MSQGGVAVEMEGVSTSNRRESSAPIVEGDTRRTSSANDRDAPSSPVTASSVDIQPEGASVYSTVGLVKGPQGAGGQEAQGVGCAGQGAQCSDGRFLSPSRANVQPDKGESTQGARNAATGSTWNPAGDTFGCTMLDLQELMKMHGKDAIEAIEKDYGNVFEICRRLKSGNYFFFLPFCISPFKDASRLFEKPCQLF